MIKSFTSSLFLTLALTLATGASSTPTKTALRGDVPTNDLPVITTFDDTIRADTARIMSIVNGTQSEEGEFPYFVNMNGW
jgi:hypothetical protein